MDEKDIKKRREYLQNKIFWLSFETIFIFGIPAFLGAFIGLKIDENYGTGKIFTLLILFFTFVLSWLLVILKYKNIKKQLSDLKK